MAKKYKRRDFMKKIYWSSLGLMGSSSLVSVLGTSCKVRSKKPPNIMLIMADDMGFSDIGCYGGEIETPHLDRLAENGLRFTRFYNAARCCPTRASLLTGLYPHQAGIGHMMADRGLKGYQGNLNKHCLTMAEVLQQAGYSTYMSGKWHLTRFTGEKEPKYNWPLQRGFDRFFGTIKGAGSYFDPVTLTVDNSFIDPPSPDFYYTQAISDYALKFIKQHLQSTPEKPFFLYTSYTAPHWPLHALKEDIAGYEGLYDLGWDVLRREGYQRMLEMNLIDSRWPLSERDPEISSWKEADHKDWQTARMEVYAAQVYRMDQGIGKLISFLERTDQLENTLIFFLSDNGGCAEEITESWEDWLLDTGISPPKTREGEPVHLSNKPSIIPGPENTYQSYGRPWANVSNTPFRLYKHWVHEGGISSPLIVHWPAYIKSRGELRYHPSHLIDIMATCVDVSGAKYPSTKEGHEIYPLEGKSLVPVFDNKPVDRDGLYFEHEGNRAVHWEKWKLVARGKDGPWELYDMETDRTETNNIAQKKPNLVKGLAGKWKAWAKRANVLPWPWK